MRTLPAVVAAFLLPLVMKSSLTAAPLPAGKLIGCLPRTSNSIKRSSLRNPGKEFTVAKSAALSHVALRLWRQTGSPIYRQKAQDFFTRAVSDPQFSLKDFHLLHHFGELAWAMKQEKLLSAGQEASLVVLAFKDLNAFCDSKDDGDYNIRIGQVAGYAGLRKFLDGTPLDRLSDIDRRFDAFWSKIAAAGDLDEDASNYDSLGMVFLIDLARLLGREDDFRHSANFRRQFERFRDIVSPAGLIPEYGDAYFSYATCPMDRIYLLEYAARLYDDPTFLYPARKLYRRPQAGLPGLDDWTRALALINLKLSPAEPRMPSGPPSLVTYRARQGSSPAAHRQADSPHRLGTRLGDDPPGSLRLGFARPQGKRTVHRVLREPPGAALPQHGPPCHAVGDRGKPLLGPARLAAVPRFGNGGERLVHDEHPGPVPCPSRRPLRGCVRDVVAEFSGTQPGLRISLLRQPAAGGARRREDHRRFRPHGWLGSAACKKNGNRQRGRQDARPAPRNASPGRQSPRPS